MCDLRSSDLSFKTLSDEDVALIGYQRTDYVQAASRKAWDTGDRAPLMAEVQSNRSAILAGVAENIRQEMEELSTALKAVGQFPKQIVDIGCGAGIADIFLAHEFGAEVTLVDIETTEHQYHGFNSQGSGYASLPAAKQLLAENGVLAAQTINPQKDSGAIKNLAPDLVMSLISCGFHYPIDDYAELMFATLKRGGAVCLDLRAHYERRGTEALRTLLDAGNVGQIEPTDPRRRRLLISG